MKEKTKRLRELQEQKQRRVHLESLRAELTKQQRELSEKTLALKAAMVNEQADVDRLQRGGLVSLFYELLGSKEKKLEKEKQEAYAARMKYEAAAREQADLEHRLRRANEEYCSLRESEGEYDRLLGELLREIKAAGDSRSEEVLRTEQEIGRHNEVIREITEAIARGGPDGSLVSCARQNRRYIRW